MKCSQSIWKRKQWTWPDSSSKNLHQAKKKKQDGFCLFCVIFYGLALFAWLVWLESLSSWKRDMQSPEWTKRNVHFIQFCKNKMVFFRAQTAWICRFLFNISFLSSCFDFQLILSGINIAWVSWARINSQLIDWSTFSLDLHFLWWESRLEVI